jgi:cell division septation protein DedD
VTLDRTFDRARAVAATLGLLAALAAVPRAEAGLSVIPGRPGVRPTPQVTGSLAACQDTIRRASAELAAAARDALSACLAASLPCVLQHGGARSCCAGAAGTCIRQAEAIDRAGADFVAQVTGRGCATVVFERLAGEDGLDLSRAAEACLRLTPPVAVDGLGSLATCLQRLVTEDVLHLVANTEQPRALEALVCMDIEDRFAGVLRQRPATCEELAAPPSPTPVATPTPAPSTSPAGSPTPTASGGATPTPAGGTPTPNATPTTAGGDPCTSPLSVTVAVDYDAVDNPNVSGITVGLSYPTAVSIPGIQSEPSVVERVTNLTGVQGALFQVGDVDTNQDNTDDRVNIGVISLSSTVPPGSFARVRFDCSQGASIPPASAFPCTVDASTFEGNPVTAQCVVTVGTP